MHYYQFHPADYMLSTAHLDLEHDLAYRRLLDHYYSTEEPISLETQLVSRRLRLGYDVVIEVLKEFFQETENGWIQDRCQREIAAYQAKAEVAKRNGSLGGRPKKTQRVSRGNPAGTGSKPNHKLTKNHKPGTNNQFTLEGEDDAGANSWNPTPEQIEVASWFSRRATTEWSAKELKAWKAVQPINAEDFEAVKWFYTESGCPYLRKDLQTLLNNWNGEVDRAKNYDPEKDKRR